MAGEKCSGQSQQAQREEPAAGGANSAEIEHSVGAGAERKLVRRVHGTVEKRKERNEPPQ